jgi:hypothetical protein
MTIIHGPHADFELRSETVVFSDEHRETWDALEVTEYEPGSLMLTVRDPAFGAGHLIAVQGEPGEPIEALRSALGEELCRIWCCDVWGTERGKDENIMTFSQVEQIQMVLGALACVTPRKGGAAGHVWTPPRMPLKKFLRADLKTIAKNLEAGASLGVFGL